MGKLRGLDADRAAKALLDNAQDLAAKKEEGALLGALLFVREGEDPRERVVRLLAPLDGAPGVGDRTLLDIYAMIAGMHAENQLYLSRTVLAFALGCDEAELDRGPLHVLRREAMVDGGTAYVLTRHQRIAEAARDWLVEVGENPDRWFPVLARAALAEFRERRSGNPDISKWQYGLARHFVERGREAWPIARAVAKALFEYDPNDAMRLTVYASTLRRTGQPGAALDLLRAEGPRFARHRGVLYEWSVAAGEAGDHGLDVWLAARSLADDPGKPFEKGNVKLALAGLGAAFRDLDAKTGAQDFSAAQAACGRLGLRLTDLDATARSYFERYETAGPAPAGPPPSLVQDLETLRATVVAASYQTEPASDPPFFERLIGDPEGYRFTMLQRALERS